MYINKPQKTLFILLWMVYLGIIVISVVGCSGENEVKSVKTINIKEEKHTVVCPFCRKRISLQNFKDAIVPNMKLCPECNKQVPTPLLLRQTILKKR